MVKLEHIHISHCYGICEFLSCTAVSEIDLSIFRIIGFSQGFHDVFLVCPVKYRRGNVYTKLLGCKPKVDLQYLSQVHTGWYSKRIQHYVNRGSVRHIRHVLLRHNPGDDTLVSMSSTHFVSDIYFSLGCYIYPDHLIYARRQLIAVVSGVDLHINDDTGFAMRHSQ